MQEKIWNLVKFLKQSSFLLLSAFSSVIGCRPCSTAPQSLNHRSPTTSMVVGLIEKLPGPDFCNHGTNNPITIQKNKNALAHWLLLTGLLDNKEERSRPLSSCAIMWYAVGNAAISEKILATLAFILEPFVYIGNPMISRVSLKVKQPKIYPLKVWHYLKSVTYP